MFDTYEWTGDIDSLNIGISEASVICVLAK